MCAWWGALGHPISPLTLTGAAAKPWDGDLQQAGCAIRQEKRCQYTLFGGRMLPNSLCLRVCCGCGWRGWVPVALVCLHLRLHPLAAHQPPPFAAATGLLPAASECCTGAPQAGGCGKHGPHSSQPSCLLTSTQLSVRLLFLVRLS